MTLHEHDWNVNGVFPMKNNVNDSIYYYILYNALYPSIDMTISRHVKGNYFIKNYLRYKNIKVGYNNIDY